jgi:hypothetical protein
MPCAADSGLSSVVDILNVTSGTWSTAALSQARGFVAATSLPDAGVVIFAGGGCTSCYGLFGVLRDGYGCEGYAWIGVSVVVFIGNMCMSHALCSGRQNILQCCGHLQRDIWNLEYRSSQPGSNWSCSHVAAGCRSRDLRWWRMYVLLWVVWCVAGWVWV